MSTYNWTQNSLIRCLPKIKRLIDNASTLEEKFYYLKVFDSLSLVIVQRDIDVKGLSKANLQDKHYSIAESINFYGRYYSLIEQVYLKLKEADNFCFDVTEAINERVKKDKDFIMDTGAYIGHDKAINMAKCFYERFDSELFEYFMNVYNKRYSSFKFIPFDEKQEKRSDCLYVDGAKRTFIEIANGNGVKKYGDIVHEFGHSIAFQMNPKIIYDENLNFYDEVPSMFPEIVALYEGFNGKDKDDYLYAFFCSLAACGDEISLLSLHQPIAFAWSDNEHKCDKNLIHKTTNELEIEDSEYKAALDTDLLDIGSYITSLGVSLGLLNIYKQDKKEALKLFKEIIRMPLGVDANAYVLSRVPISDAITEELDIFQKEFTLSLKKKGINL